MSKIQVFTDTGADMTDELKAFGVKIVPLYITFDGKTSLKQMEEITLDDFYKRMREPHDMHPRTSLAPIGDYIDIFTDELEKGNDVLYLCMNGKFSSTLGAANNAKQMLEEEFPDRKIEVIDSKTVTYGQHYMAREAQKMADNGASMEEIVSMIKNVQESIKYFFTVETLDYLRDGGRIGGAEALLGGLLNIKPVLLIDNDAEVKAITKVRGRNKSLDAIIDEAEKFFEGKDKSKYNVTILEGDILDEAMEFKKDVEERLGITCDEVCRLGISIGLHAGPGTMGISIIEKP